MGKKINWFSVVLASLIGFLSPVLWQLAVSFIAWDFLETWFFVCLGAFLAIAFGIVVFCEEVKRNG